MNSFVALDVETANPNYASICAIGAARYEGGFIVDEWYRLVDPCDEFYWKNVEIHGIRPDDVSGQPRFAELAPELREFVDGRMVAHHGHFDRNALSQASDRWQLPPPDWGFVDTLHAARQAWPQRRRDGYRLSDLCRDIGYELVQQHNALDDARGAGAVFLAAHERLGDELIAALTQKIAKVGERELLWSADVDLSLMRDVIVFSQGASSLATDAQLAATLKRRGAKVQRQLTDATTIYVLSHAEWWNETRSGQRRRAGQRVGQGQRLQIMSETDFLAMIEHG